MGQQAGFAFVILGTIFLFIGIFSCAIALARRGSARKVLGWFGIFSGMYGVRLFAAVPAAFRLLVGQLASHAQQFVWIITFLMFPTWCSVQHASDKTGFRRNACTISGLRGWALPRR